MLARIGLVACCCWTAVSLAGCGGGEAADVEIVNVSYDPTRELYAEVNATFVRAYQEETGKRVRVVPSHGGSGSQARAVIDGLKADVITLALAGDVQAIADKGLIAPDWQQRLPDNACPYTSTVVFVVRKGNPKQIRDWPDLARPGVQVVTPNPKTSGGARWNFLAAWGFVTVHQQKGEAEARELLGGLYGNVLKLDTGARGASDTFVRRKLGDVLIAWENEALFARHEAAGEGLEIMYPSASIRAEPPVAVVDRVVDQRGTRAVAEAYLKFLYTDAAQEIAGKHGYRPGNPDVLRKYADTLPPLPLFTLRAVAGDWGEAQRRFFADGGVFDQIYQKGA